MKNFIFLSMLFFSSESFSTDPTSSDKISSSTSSPLSTLTFQVKSDAVIEDIARNAGLSNVRERGGATGFYAAQAENAEEAVLKLKARNDIEDAYVDKTAPVRHGVPSAVSRVDDTHFTPPTSSTDVVSHPAPTTERF